MKTLKTPYVLMILAVIAGTSCQSVDIPVSEPEVELTEPTWQLVAFVEADGDRITIDRNSSDIPSHAYTITFTKQPAQECISNEKNIHGAWCTELTGYPNTSPSTTYDLDTENDQSLSIYFRGTTFVGQPEGSKETAFFKALDASKSYQINDIQLRIFYGEDGKALLFEPLETGKQE